MVSFNILVIHVMRRERMSEGAGGTRYLLFYNVKVTLSICSCFAA